MKTLSVFRTHEGIIVERRNEFGTAFESVFETENGLLECLDHYKRFDTIGDYKLNISNEFFKLVYFHLNR